MDKLTKKGLDGTQLKTIALALMVLDHIHYFFEFTGCIPTVFNMLGRLSAPLFLFCTVEGFAHTHDRRRYFIRIWGIGTAMAALEFFMIYAKVFRRGDGFYPLNAIFQDLMLLCIVWQGIDWLREKKFAKGIAAIAAVLCWPFVMVAFLSAFPQIQQMPWASTVVAFVITSPLPLWTSITDGSWSFLLGGMDLSGYDNTISVGQLKTRPDQSLAAALKEYATSCCASGNGDLRPEQAIQRLEEQKKTIDKEIREALYERQRQRETVEQEASFVWREIHRLEEEEEQIRERIRQAERTRREQGEHKRLVDEIRPAKWRIHPLEIVIFLIAIVAAIFLFQRPLNYFVVIVVFLACTVYVWNRMKVGKDKNQVSPEEIMEEILPEEERASVEKLDGSWNALSGSRRISRSSMKIFRSSWRRWT